MKALGALGLYVLLTVLLTWPMVRRLRVVDAGDSAFFAWIMGWEVHALGSDPRQLPHANIFHPLRYTLGLDEPVLGTTVLVLPLALVTDDAVLLMNVARLLTFALSGLTAYLLAKSLGSREPAALLAGAAFAFSPIRIDQIAHLSTLGTQWLPLVLLFMHRFFRDGRRRDALLAGLFFALETLACGYHGLLALAVLPPAVLVLVWGRWSRLLGAALGAALAGLLLWPLYRLHRAALAPMGFARGPEETIPYSAALESFLATSGWNRLYGDLTAVFRTTYANNLFPGLVLPAVVVTGAVLLIRARQRPGRDAVALAVMGLTAMVVALGPEVRLFGHLLGPGPFAALRALLPPFRMIHVPSRAGIFLALALAVLAARAFDRWPRRPWVVAVLGAAMLAETSIVPVPMPDWMQVVDSGKPPPPVYEWLAAQPGRPPVLELPIQGVAGVFERPAYHESIYMVRSTRHWKPLANGYAGVEPPSYVELRERSRRFPSAESLAAFRERGVRYVILHRRGYGPNRLERLDRELPAFGADLTEVARFGEDVVYELAAGPP